MLIILKFKKMSIKVKESMGIEFQQTTIKEKNKKERSR